MKITRAFCALLLVPALWGCGTEDPASGEDNLVGSKKLVGAYEGGSFMGLVLTDQAAGANAKVFFADIAPMVKCKQGPGCPTRVRVEGTYTSGSKNLTLKADDASNLVKGMLGKYTYKISNGKLSLSREGVTASLTKLESYCSAELVENDCTAQNIPTTSCFGVFACIESACVWNCVDPGESCGGFAGFQCGADQYCDYTPQAMCGAGDQMGTCTPRPAGPGDCLDAPNPVCGCDGKTYAHACDAHLHGTSVSKNGSCNGEETD